MLNDPTAPDLTLAELATASGLEPRTIRSWIAQGLLPPPKNRGPSARYPAETLQRLLAIVAMREVLGMSLADIRLDLLAATPEKVAAMAARFASVPPKPNRPAGDPRDALDYLDALGGKPADRFQVRASRAPTAPVALGVDMASMEEPALFQVEAPTPQPRTGLGALERALGGPRPNLQRRSRTEEWLRIPITPDLELSARGPLDPEAKAQLERCAALIRSIITGGQS